MVEMNDFVDGSFITEVDEVEVRLKNIKETQIQLLGFLKGLDYNKEVPILAKIKNDVWFIVNIIERLINPKLNDVKCVKDVGVEE